MKTPHAASAFLAACTLLAGHSASQVSPAVNKRDDSPEHSGESYIRKVHGRMGLNQRQKRKDRRRAHAPGCKKAFA
jgi:hypothetical protein